MVDATLAPMFEIYKTRAADANSLAAKIKAATSDQTEAVNAVLDTSTDPDVTAWRERNAKGEEQIKAAQQKLAEAREAIKAKALTLLPNADPDFNPEKAKEEFIDQRKSVNALRNALLQLMGGDEKALSEAVTEFGIVEVVSLGRNSTGTRAKGSKEIRRPRIATANVDGESWSDSKGKVSFTGLAGYLGVDGDTLRTAAFNAAGTNDLSSLPAGTEVKFQVTKGDKTRNVVVTTLGKPEKEEKAKPEEKPAE